MTGVPLWLVALILAGAAPFLAGALQSLLERRLRRRTLDTIERARKAPTETDVLERR